MLNGIYPLYNPDAPSRLKKGVEAILTLQAEIERVDEAIADVRNKFEKALAMPDSGTILQALEYLSTDLSQRAESLYSSLNVSDIFPELKDVHPDFVRTLVLTRDIKINVRKRVTAQLLEFDRIDQAAGGKDNPLGKLSFLSCTLFSRNDIFTGTKLHQYTRRSIARRQPAIRSAIRKYNRYVETLQQLAAEHNIPENIPIPQPLSPDVNTLRNDPNLYEDVWIYPLDGDEKPRWLYEQSTRLAIRALLKMERCAEEEVRLQREVNHMCWWLGREIAVTELALHMIQSMSAWHLRHYLLIASQILYIAPSSSNGSRICCFCNLCGPIRLTQRLAYGRKRPGHVISCGPSWKHLTSHYISLFRNLPLW